MKFGIAALLVVGCIAIGNESIAQEEEAPSVESVEMYQESCRVRGLRGLREQSLDNRLCRVAQRWANHMAATKQMKHGGGEQVIASGYSTCNSCFRGWLNSDGHRRWVLGSEKKCGFASARSVSGRLFWVGVYRNSPTVTTTTKTCTTKSCSTNIRRKFRLFR